MENPSIIDLQEIDRKIKTPDTKEEVEFKKNQIRSFIDNAGLRGFFVGQKTPIPDGIVLDYDTKEVSKEIEKAKGL